MDILYARNGLGVSKLAVIGFFEPLTT